MNSRDGSVSEKIRARQQFIEYCLEFIERRNRLSQTGNIGEDVRCGRNGERVEGTTSQDNKTNIVASPVDIEEKEKDSVKKTLPLVFQFEDEEPLPMEKEEWEKEVDNLFAEMDMCLLELRNGLKNPSVLPKQSENISGCQMGNHQLICKNCSYAHLESKDISHAFPKPTSMENQGSDNLHSSIEVPGQAQMRREDWENQPSELHDQSQGQATNLLQETGAQVKSIAQGAADIAQGAAGSAVNMAREAATGAANMAQGAAEVVKNTLGMNPSHNITDDTAGANYFNQSGTINFNDDFSNSNTSVPGDTNYPGGMNYPTNPSDPSTGI